MSDNNWKDSGSIGTHRKDAGDISKENLPEFSKSWSDCCMKLNDETERLRALKEVCNFIPDGVSWGITKNYYQLARKMMSAYAADEDTSGLNVLLEICRKDPLVYEYSLELDIVLSVNGLGKNLVDERVFPGLMEVIENSIDLELGRCIKHGDTEGLLSLRGFLESKMCVIEQAF